jgi:amino acid adenylation domain-containing protein
MDRAPLSPGQERIWFLNKFLPGEVVYNIAGAYRVTGDLSTEGLEWAVNQLVARHEALRTRFEESGGIPVQVVVPERPIRVECRAVTPESLDKEVTAFARAPFDLALDSLLRVLLIRTRQNDLVLALAIHHIIADGWSLGILIRELGALYSEYVTGKHADLPPLGATYIDYSLWLRSEGPGQVDLDYWLSELRGAPRLIQLPTDRARPAVQSFNGRRLEFAVPLTLIRHLEAWARSQGATPYMALLTVFYALLHRWSGQDRITCATPVAGRTSIETESLMGFFVNTLVMPVEVSDGLSFAGLLARVRQRCLDSFARQQVPFEQIVGALALDRELSHNPLAQVMFILQSAPTEAMAMEGATLTPRPAETGTAKFDITLEFTPAKDTWDGVLEYAADLFDPATMERFAVHYLELLRAMLADPAQPITTAPMLSAAEREQLAAWNLTECDTELGDCAHDWIAQRARQSPDRAALQAGDTVYTYRELADRAGAVANLLVAKGASAGCRIGLRFRRSPDMVLALLGVLASGSCYVPLDPDLPDERTRFLVADAGIGILLTASDSPVPDLPGDVQVIALDEPGTVAELARQPGQWPRTGGTDSDLAYVIYTSGSTGEPKGVMIEHRSLVNRINWMQREYQLTAADRVLQKTAYTFDVSVWEFLWPLMHGATLVLASPDAHRDPAQLLTEIRCLGVTHVHFVPTALAAALDNASFAGSSLRRIFCSGEALPEELCERVYRDCGIAIDNLYGPTECAIDVTRWSWRPGDSGPPPIGRPVANTQAYVTDSAGNEVPVGVPGELLISGVQVARGYLNRPVLTAERFGSSHLAAGQRVYRTGDVVRRLPDGSLQYLGRSDDQVKIRGFRVEPGEIEAALRRFPAVTAAAVTCAADAVGDKQLMAYVTADSGVLAAMAGDAGGPGDWASVFDRVYAEGPDPDDAALNLKGWISSYTREPLPQDEMLEWLGATVTKITAAGGRTCLEIGCGTGLLLLRLAGQIDRYVGVDVSGEGLSRIAAEVARRGWRDRVELRRLGADGIGALAGQQFDLIVINSVAQYFPSRNYLDGVLRAAAGLLAPGGKIFLGDIRHKGLAEAFHYSVVRHRQPGLDHQVLLSRARRRVAEEVELLLDPAYFAGLQATLPGLLSVETSLKAGRSDNELTGYRYDVLLDFGVAPCGALATPRTWDDELDTMTALRALVADWVAARSRQPLTVDGIPNARLDRDTRAALGRAPHENAVHPEDLRELAAAHGVRVHLTWAVAGADEGRVAATFLEHGHDRVATVHTVFGPVNSDPARGAALRELPRQLRRWLRETLPSYMVPSAITVLAALPLTTSGKVNRAALDAAADERQADLGAAQPTTSAERLLAEIWGDVLGVPVLSRQDNFFDLGGDSIKSTQVAARLREAGKPVMVRSIFTHQTVAALAAFLDEQDDACAGTVLAASPARTTDPGRYPLSPAQRHMLAVLPGTGQDGMYVVQRILRYEGTVDAAAAGLAWRRTVRQIPLLRTSLRPGPDGGRCQQVDEAAPGVTVAVMDWSGRPAGEQAALLDRFLADDRALGFDPAAPPPTRLAFIRTAATRGCWVITMDYRRLDGWSFPLYLERFLDEYRCLVSAVAAPEPAAERTFDYGSYVAWRDDAARHHDVRAWWSGQAARLERVPAIAPGSTSPFEVVQVRLRAGLLRPFTASCRAAQVTIAAGLQACWGAVQQSADGRAAPQFGVTSSGRPAQLAGIESATGMFMNTLPVQWEAGQADSARDWFSRASRAVLNLIEHDTVSLTEVEHMAGVSPGETLIDSYLVYQNTPGVGEDALAGSSFRLADDPPVAFAQQEHRLRVDIYPDGRGGLDILLSGYEPTERLARYLGALRDLLLTTDADHLGEPMGRLIARPTPLGAPAVVTARSCVQALVAGTKLPHVGEAGQ